MKEQNEIDYSKINYGNKKAAMLVKKLRLSLGLTQTSMAKQLNCHCGLLSSIENERRDLTDSVRTKLITLYNLDPNIFDDDSIFNDTMDKLRKSTYRTDVVSISNDTSYICPKCFKVCNIKHAYITLESDTDIRDQRAKVLPTIIGKHDGCDNTFMLNIETILIDDVVSLMKHNVLSILEDSHSEYGCLQINISTKVFVILKGYKDTFIKKCLAKKSISKMKSDPLILRWNRYSTTDIDEVASFLKRFRKDYEMIIQE